MESVVAIPTKNRPKELERLLVTLEIYSREHELPRVFVFNHAEHSPVEHITRTIDTPITVVSLAQAKRFGESLAAKSGVDKKMVKFLLEAGIGGWRNFMQLYLGPRKVVFLDDDVILGHISSTIPPPHPLNYGAMANQPKAIALLDGKRPLWVGRTYPIRDYSYSDTISPVIETLLAPLGRQAGEFPCQRGDHIMNMLFGNGAKMVYMAPAVIPDNAKIHTASVFLEGKRDTSLSGMVNGDPVIKYCFQEPVVLLSLDGYSAYSTDLAVTGSIPFIPNPVPRNEKLGLMEIETRYEDLLHGECAQYLVGGAAMLVQDSVIHMRPKVQMEASRAMFIDDVSYFARCMILECVAEARSIARVPDAIAHMIQSGIEDAFGKYADMAPSAQLGKDFRKELLGGVYAHLKYELMKASTAFYAWPRILEAASTL